MSRRIGCFISNWKLEAPLKSSPVLSPVKCTQCGRAFNDIRITVPYGSVVGNVVCENCNERRTDDFR